MILIFKGFVGICFQALFLREILSVFFGNEFSIGITLALWLLGGGIGSYIFRKKYYSHALLYLCFTIFQNFFVLGAIFFIRISRIFLGVLPGQSFSLSGFFLIIFLFSFSAGFLEGARFVTATFFYKNEVNGGKVYGFEGIGALLGGLCFPLFLMSGISPFYLIFIFGLLNLLSLVFFPERVKVKNFIIGAWVILSFFSSLIEKKSLSTQWQPFTVIESFYSLYGNLTIISQKEEIILMRDGIPEVSNQPDSYFMKNLSFFSLTFHPHPQKILLFGNPEVVSELLKYPLDEIHFLEIDPQYISLIKKYFVKKEEKNLIFHAADPYSFLMETEEKFDVVIFGRTLPLSLKENRLFTGEFLSLVTKCLRKNGIICLSLPGSYDYMGENLLYLHGSIYKTFKEKFPYEKIIFTYPLIYLFSGSDLQKINVEFLIDSDFFNSSYLLRVLNPYRESYFKKLLLSRASLPNSNFSSAAIYYGFSYWFSTFHPKLGNFILNVFSTLLNLKKFIYLLFLFFFILWMIPTKERSILYLLSFTNGFLSLSFEMLLLFLFQIHFGYLYFQISILIGIFMAGLSIGGLLSGVKKMKKKYLFLSEIFHFGFYFLIFISVFYFKGLPLSFFIFCLLISGFFIGWEFGILTFILKKDKMSEEIGRVYSLDLIGALLGCVFLPFFILPVFGIAGCFFLFALIKFANMLNVGKVFTLS